MPNTIPRLSASENNRAKAGIVHLGLGAFFRAHGAIYISQSMEKSGGDWGIIGVSLVRPNQRDLLAPQGFAYTAVQMGPSGEIPKVISVIENVLVAREEPEAVLEAMADPHIKIVSLTVTEKGYCHEPATGALNHQHPDIVHDLNNKLPQSAPGYLVRALQMRRAAGIAPFTVLCCDNLSENGNVVRAVVLELAQLLDPSLAAWIALEGAFPSTMVDRIVPATKPIDIETLAEKTGVLDLSPVMHEPFRQWVVEDRFVNGDRPDFEAVGVQMVRNVTPYENMKLRCLNGTHSALAYLGYLAGYKTIYDTVCDPAFADYCKYLWKNEIVPSFSAPEGSDPDAYTKELFARYENPAIAHLTWQIAMDGSQKLPQRFLGTVMDNMEQGLNSPGLILAIAAWMRYVGGTDENGNDIDVRDPLANRLKTLSDDVESAADKVKALLSVREVFPEVLVSNIEFVDAVIAAYEKLLAIGAQNCARAIPGTSV